MKNKKTAAKKLLTEEPGAGRNTRIQAQNRSKLVDAAIVIFAQFGYSGATIVKIAREANMSKNNLLYYFKSKEELYLTVLQGIMVRWLAPLEDLQADMDPVEEISAYIDAKFKFSRVQPLSSKVWANEIISGARVIRPLLETQLQDILKRKTTVIKAWQDEGKIGEIHPQHFMFLIWAVSQTYADFSSQITAITGKSLKDKEFYANAVENAKRVLLYGVIPRS